MAYGAYCALFYTNFTTILLDDFALLSYALRMSRTYLTIKLTASLGDAGYVFEPP